MNSNKKIYSERRSLTHGWREIFRRRRVHDPMLVLNMSIFTVDNGWDRTLQPAESSPEQDEMKVTQKSRDKLRREACNRLGAATLPAGTSQKDPLPCHT